MKLIKKLVHLEEKTIEDVDRLKEKLNEEEYVSFSGVIRRLIRLGLQSIDNKDVK
jgi:Arc/MetJ-type ribon-helix-helix transcriptional regulator